MLGRVADPAKIDTSTPHPARVYDYWLGGKDNFVEADRQAGLRAAIKIFPHTASRRGCLPRLPGQGGALSGRARPGIRQFLDIGTGLPSGDNVHEVAQSAAPDSRIVYVDNDPIVLLHA